MKVTSSRSKFGNPKLAVKNATKKTNIELGMLIASQAKLLTPVDEGQLRNSISVSSPTSDFMLNDRPSEEHAERLNTVGLSSNEVMVGSNSDHTIYQEYGTIKQPAQPFLRPSAEIILSKKPLEKIMSDYSREAMEEQMRKVIIKRSK